MDFSRAQLSKKPPLHPSPSRSQGASQLPAAGGWWEAEGDADVHPHQPGCVGSPMPLRRTRDTGDTLLVFWATLSCGAAPSWRPSWGGHGVLVQTPDLMGMGATSMVGAQISFHLLFSKAVSQESASVLRDMWWVTAGCSKRGREMPQGWPVRTKGDSCFCVQLLEQSTVLSSPQLPFNLSSERPRGGGESGCAGPGPVQLPGMLFPSWRHSFPLIPLLTPTC